MSSGTERYINQATHAHDPLTHLHPLAANYFAGFSNRYPSAAFDSPSTDTGAYDITDSAEAVVLDPIAEHHALITRIHTSIATEILPHLHTALVANITTAAAWQQSKLAAYSQGWLYGLVDRFPHADYVNALLQHTTSAQITTLIHTAVASCTPSTACNQLKQELQQEVATAAAAPFVNAHAAWQLFGRYTSTSSPAAAAAIVALSMAEQCDSNCVDAVVIINHYTPQPQHALLRQLYEEA